MDRACIDQIADTIDRAIRDRCMVRVTLHPKTMEVSGLAPSDLALEGWPTRVIGDSFGIIHGHGPRVDYTLGEPSRFDPAVVAVEVLP